MKRMVKEGAKRLLSEITGVHYVLPNARPLSMMAVMGIMAIFIATKSTLRLAISPAASWARTWFYNLTTLGSRLRSRLGQSHGKRKSYEMNNVDNYNEIMDLPSASGEGTEWWS